MNILILEDRGSVAYYMKEAITHMGHIPFTALNVCEAQQLQSNQIDSVIADLNMSPEGLHLHEIEQTQYGALTGWVWLKEYVFKQNPAMKSRTIIHSNYIDILKESVSSEELEGIYLVPKCDKGNITKQLFNAIEEIHSKIA